MRLLFPAMHGSGAMEIAILCKESGIGLSFVTISSQVVRSLVKSQETARLRLLGAAIIDNDAQLMDELSSHRFDAVIMGHPEQVVQFQRNSPVPLPFIIRHGLSSFGKFAELGTKNFISSSRVAIDRMGAPNSFLMRKLLEWCVMPKPACAEEKKGFHSYIHHYQRWIDAYAKFQRLNELLAPNEVTNYGFDSPAGRIDDLTSMVRSKGTVHIKGGQAVCNAVIRSLATGTPVVMDAETHALCYFDEIQGLIVCPDIEGVAAKIRQLDQMGPDEMDELATQTRALAMRQFEFDPDLGQRFVNFLNELR